jgi:hypothetical protein
MTQALYTRFGRICLGFINKVVASSVVLAVCQSVVLVPVQFHMPTLPSLLVSNS